MRVDVYATQQQRPVPDLTREDFEVFEDGVPQQLSTFEHVQIRTGGPQDARVEPNTIQESRDALKNPRARVFVLFLDVAPHLGRRHLAFARGGDPADRPHARATTT